MTALVQALQVVSGLTWIAVAVMLVPGSLRVLLQKGDAIDAGRVPLMVIGLVQFGFALRWQIWPRSMSGMGQAELAWWASLYALSAAAAVFCILAHRAFNKSLR